MNVNEMLKHVDHTLLTQTATWEEIKQICDDAVKYETVTYTEVLNKNLKVMDATAISLCRENKLPIIVFDSLTEGNIKRVIMGEKIGTTVIAD